MHTFLSTNKDFNDMLVNKKVIIFGKMTGHSNFKYKGRKENPHMHCVK